MNNNTVVDTVAALEAAEAEVERVGAIAFAKLEAAEATLKLANAELTAALATVDAGVAPELVRGATTDRMLVLLQLAADAVSRAAAGVVAERSKLSGSADVAAWLKARDRRSALEAQVAAEGAADDLTDPAEYTSAEWRARGLAADIAEWNRKRLEADAMRTALTASIWNGAEN